MQQFKHRLAWLAVCMSTVVQAQVWPVIELPPNVDTFTVGDQLTANGVPMRVRGFVAKHMTVAQAVDWFKRSMGQPLVENKLGKQIILGRAQGGFYFTVQIESMREGGFGGVKGLTAVSDIAAFNAGKSQQVREVSRWLDRWPAGTQEMNRMSSQDHQKTSVYMSLRNGHSAELNRLALIDALKQDGLSLERETAKETRAGMSLLFKGVHKEATATIAKTEAGKTDIVINTITHHTGSNKQ